MELLANRKMVHFFPIIIVMCALISGGIIGCATPDLQKNSYTNVLPPDQDDNMGGSFLESQDIRTIATQISSSLLSSPEIAMNEGVTRVAIAPIRNSTRYIIDKNIFMKRLRMELNKVAQNRIRFFSQGLAQDVRRQVLQELDENDWDELIDDAANFIANSSLVSNAKTPLKVAVIPVQNTNIVGLNAESFTALVRSSISGKASGKIIFLAREKNGKIIDQILAESDLRNFDLVESTQSKNIAGVDYFLGGEFIVKSLSKEHQITKVEKSIGLDKNDPGKTLIQEKKIQETPNVDKYLNLMLIDAQSGAIPLEKLMKIEKKMKSGLGKADFILSGELSGLSKAVKGNRSDYVIMSFQLIDPHSNEILWEDFYETKKVTNRSVLYK